GVEREVALDTIHTEGHLSQRRRFRSEARRSRSNVGNTLGGGSSSYAPDYHGGCGTDQEVPPGHFETAGLTHRPILSARPSAAQKENGGTSNLVSRRRRVREMPSDCRSAMRKGSSN